MRTLIIEDEHLPAKRLEKLLLQAKPDAQILPVLQTVDESITWFRSNPHPDLVFMDIHLADGISFEIFDETEIKCPIIFTTAYDQYALKAFEVNSIDYLLKPIRTEDLDRALTKLDFLSRMATEADNSVTPDNVFDIRNETLRNLALMLTDNLPSYRQSFFVTHKDTLIPVQVSDIAYFYVEDKMVRACSFEGKCYNLDGTLEELARQLDPKEFFRANRQYVISRRAIRNIATWFGSRAVVNLTVPSERIIVSRTHVSELKKWVTMPAV